MPGIRFCETLNAAWETFAERREPLSHFLFSSGTCTSLIPIDTLEKMRLQRTIFYGHYNIVTESLGSATRSQRGIHPRLTYYQVPAQQDSMRQEVVQDLLFKDHSGYLSKTSTASLHKLVEARPDLSISQLHIRNTQMSFTFYGKPKMTKRSLPPSSNMPTTTVLSAVTSSTRELQPERNPPKLQSMHNKTTSSNEIANILEDALRLAEEWEDDLNQIMLNESDFNATTYTTWSRQ